MSLTASGPGVAQAQAGAEPNVQAYAANFFDQFHPTTAMAMVSNVPGFSFDDGSGARGYSGTAGNVLIDGGRPPEDLGNVLGRISANAVDRIDLIRGGAPGIDMHGKTVIVNVILKRRANTSGAVNGSVTVNSRGDPSASDGFQIRRQNGDRFVDASVALSGDNNNDIGGTTVRLDPMGAVLKDSLNQAKNADHHYEVRGAIETPFANGQLRANLHLSTETYQSANTSNQVILPNGAELSGADNVYNQGELGLRYSRNLANGAAWETVFLQQYSANPQNSYFDTSAFYNTSAFASGSKVANTTGQSVLSSTLTLPTHGPWTFEGGAEAAYNWTDGTSAYSLNGQPFALAGDQSRVQELRGEAFVTGTWRPLPTLTAETGLRYEQSQISASGNAGSDKQDLSYLKPRVNLTWSPTKTDQWGLRVERTVNQLSFSSFASQASFSTGVFGIGNPEIRPETVWIAELRYEKRFADRGSVQVLLSRSRADDLAGSVAIFVPDPAGGPPNLYNIAKNDGPAFSNNLAINTNLPLDRLGLSGWTLTTHNGWVISRIQDPVTAIIRRLSGEAPVNWNIGLARSRPNSKFSWGVNLYGPSSNRNFAPQSTGSYKSTYTLNANISYQVTPAFVLNAGLNNLGAGGYRNIYSQYAGPRNLVFVPTYDETSLTPGYSAVVVGFRKGF
jgi:outer membrane receptor protein involved in Fe transport